MTESLAMTPPPLPEKRRGGGPAGRRAGNATVTGLLVQGGLASIGPTVFLSLRAPAVLGGAGVHGRLARST